MVGKVWWGVVGCGGVWWGVVNASLCLVLVALQLEARITREEGIVLTAVHQRPRDQSPPYSYHFHNKHNNIPLAFVFFARFDKTRFHRERKTQMKSARAAGGGWRVEGGGGWR